MISTSVLLTTPFELPVTISEGIPSYLAVWLVTLILLIVLFFLLRRALGKFWFWVWDRYIELQRPSLVFRNLDDHSLDISLPASGDSRFNFSRTSFLISGIENWEPGLLKVRRGFTLGHDVILNGKYLPRGGKAAVRFHIRSGNKFRHNIKGLPDDFVFIVEKNALKTQNSMSSEQI